MARLQVRMEMNQGGMGVPLQKLVGVAGEAHRFFNMLCEDIRIDTSLGQWLALEFDETSLSFTVEFIGPLNPAQVREFYDAFSGATPLRRTTIAQFARIADSIDEDEMIGFGFYQTDDDNEPTEWRSLSRRDALRIGEEMRTLTEAVEQSRPHSHMPQSAGLEHAASYFRERRDHDRPGSESFLRAVESRFLQRITRLETDVAEHTVSIQNLKEKSVSVEESVKHLLAAVEDFCDRASRQFSRLPASEAPALEPAQLPQAPEAVPSLDAAAAAAPPRRWYLPVAAALVVAMVGGLYSMGVFDSRPKPAPRPQLAAPTAKPPEPPAAPAPPANRVAVQLQAADPCWIAVFVGARQTFVGLLEPGQTKAFEANQTIRVRAGNAGGLSVQWNGRAVGPLGPKGQVRLIEFSARDYRLLPLTPPAAPTGKS